MREYNMTDIFYEFIDDEGTALDRNDITSINDLLQQLSPNPARENVRFEHLMNVARTSRLLVARNDTRIIGMGTLVPVIKPTGRDGYIEDVVVDQSYRGQGIGEVLTQELIDEARRLRLDNIGLTSQPSRVAANQLYQKLGFVRRETNVYNLPLT